MPPPVPAPVPARAPRRGVPAVLLVALTVLAGLLVGGGGGALIASATTKPHGPSAPGRLPNDFPNNKQWYLPGVTVGLVADKWLKKINKWTCEPWTQNEPLSGAKSWLACTAPGSLKYDVGVDIEYDDKTHVRLVSADCHLGPGTQYCTALFANLAWAVLNSQPALKKKGQDWGAKNADADATTAIGGVQFTTQLEPHGITALPSAP